MAKIVISDLHHLDAKTFLHDLFSIQIDATLDNYLLHLWGGDPDLELTSIQDGVGNTSSTSNGPFGFYNNKILTIDFSRLTLNLIFLLP
ncbi:hypothetical protein [aff. Roholtiella sp. LEGE 12411]|uniref:hypothetical protein n=1 Tax=aff. Roholtiella sp. LEGE 12411 TaxID=1828822 RepID=UPI0018824E9B|nr:hypothetical protein [aff. Roholtiella sp. LEGE 12411]MBE9033788.1 hypothetical protein [aff. Roholtiella sp. LEGE 12411]